MFSKIDGFAYMYVVPRYVLRNDFLYKKQNKQIQLQLKSLTIQIERVQYVIKKKEKNTFKYEQNVVF